ncbi:PQQ-dependent sugar dehydrogenase [Novosphingobium sp. TH158]|uniref:PQQ-dependent sugar dehydrogenase n=1 Tax=Novosphingobium sp. TH158 TaxID=2067455 RepID=UPI000C7C0D8F|nr:PQQ-dependent sugar dehydrogenase [Novosphingobium sp. TH158]PLK25572.1 dehydrogenase [Novosphingobium sp. TH158]
MKRQNLILMLSPLLVPLASCGATAAGDSTIQGSTDFAEANPFTAREVAKLDEPWALALLPDGKALVTEKMGKLKLVDLASGAVSEVSGAPQVAYAGQGGFGDVVLSPDFVRDGLVYLTWAEAGDGDTRGAAMGRGKLVREGGSARIEGLEVIWRQSPKVTGRGHYAHRIVFSPDGQHLFLTSGDRQKMTPAQDLSVTLGKVLRLTRDGKPAPGNPFADKGGVSAEIWSYGHRNPLGMAFDGSGRLWDLEHGPAGGDELNLVQPGKNYGWPLVSNGDHYDGRAIARHASRPDLAAPALSWNPVIAPGGMIVCKCTKFAAWRGNALIAALGAQGLVRVSLDGETAREAERFNMEHRMRGIAEGANGSLWMIEDGPGGRLLELLPR